MKHILLPEKSENTNYYKANLHCHSTCSDGSKTPEQLKADYMAHGYSIIAYTDHHVLLNHNDLTDDNFLALNGYEINVNEVHAENDKTAKTCHICFISPKDSLIQACYHRKKYIHKDEEKYREYLQFDEALPDFEREYSTNGVNAMIKEAERIGCFVTYNHPTWSLEGYPQYSGYEGMDAMEMVNYGCVIMGYNDENSHCYDDFLHQGKRLFCIATDDNHNVHPDDDPTCDSYGGYTMIGAPSLEYGEVFDSLKSGRFYCSTGNGWHEGPQILSLSYENGCVHIRTSDARSISMTCDKRCAYVKNAPFGESVNEAKFNLTDKARWFRLTVTDNYGYKSYTNAYFIDSLK